MSMLLIHWSCFAASLDGDDGQSLVKQLILSILNSWQTTVQELVDVSSMNWYIDDMMIIPLRELTNGTLS